MDINIEKMTDETADRGLDSISILFFYPAGDRIAFHKVICQPWGRWGETKLLKKWAKGGCSSDANDKMNQARGNNDSDINNDTMKMLGGRCQGNKKTHAALATEAIFWKRQFLNHIPMTKRNQVLAVGVH